MIPRGIRRLSPPDHTEMPPSCAKTGAAGGRRDKYLTGAIHCDALGQAKIRRVGKACVADECRTARANDPAVEQSTT
jgi:hypothetical protein